MYSPLFLQNLEHVLTAMVTENARKEKELAGALQQLRLVRTMLLYCLLVSFWKVWLGSREISQVARDYLWTC